MSKRRLRSSSRSSDRRERADVREPVSSSVIAWRSTVSCRLAFSIETTAWPARYSSSSSSSRVKAFPWRAIEIAPRYSGRRRASAARSRARGPADPCARPARRVRSAPLVALERAEQLRAHVRADREDAPLGRLDRAARARRRPPRPRSPRTRRGRAAAPGRLGLACVHRLPHGQRHHAVTVEAGGERVAHAPDRLGELLALALHLLDLRLELHGHVVELAPERGELVVAVDRHGPAEVAARQTPGRREEGRDLAGERTAHVARRRQARAARTGPGDRDQQAVAAICSDTRPGLRSRAPPPARRPSTGTNLPRYSSPPIVEVADVPGRREAEAARPQESRPARARHAIPGVEPGERVRPS